VIVHKKFGLIGGKIIPFVGFTRNNETEPTNFLPLLKEHKDVSFDKCIVSDTKEELYGKLEYRDGYGY
jgi:hypothetical protein